MKGIGKVVLAAALAAGVSAQPHNHNFRHKHVKKHDHGAFHMEKRETSTVISVVAGPTVVAYVLEGQEIDAAEAEEGIQEGIYVVLGTSTPTFSAPAVTSTSVSSTSTSSSEAGQFIEEKTSSSTSSSTSTSTTSTSTTTSSSTSSSTPATSSTATSTSSSAAATGSGSSSTFPSGEIPCSTFPSAYGAVEVSWVGLNGWSSLEYVGSWTDGVAISSISEPTSGGCETGMFCSYACSPGYQKTQWPENSQGSTGQSVGGLWCNSDGYLELTRPAYTTLCEEGAGGVYVENKMSEVVAVCRTDYPGSEAMVIPLEAAAGGTYPLTNPDESTYYQWEGKTTSAQYYVNPKGVGVSDACLWTSPTNPDSAGNWAPINLGVGRDSTGTTYLSIFANSPTSSATLDFNIEITGDVSSDCYYKDGAYSGGSTGCTTAITSGGTATFVFTSS